MSYGIRGVDLSDSEVRRIMKGLSIESRGEQDGSGAITIRTRTLSDARRLASHLLNGER